MKKISAHNNNPFFRKLLATSLLLLVLLSSCSLKRGIKVLFDIPVNTVQVGNFGTQISSVSHAETACMKCADLQVLTSDSFDQSIIKNLSSAVLLTVVFSLLLLPFFRPEDKHIYKTPSFGKSIPKYLLFSKLLFYDLR
ncbi:hypothetical protein EI546_08665 [Aequorivita sp. H23M31]|uniref:Lipoprotein n=1 Tax=Aequorivita ciconiae TaxID=2494375 RepID=A0A410G3D6_9FLAO|nr:hypothetical protein [Aequorivita sp. H23M31]QAA81787.1 hypothetical protein EI546_08665 [Aequorivita sp. H23M31]